MGQGTLRYVDPARRRSWIYRVYVRLAGSRFATWLARQRIWGAITWRVDPYLMRWTKGRLGTGLLLPTALLETRGARTGLPRCNAVIYFHDGERVTIFASQAGLPENPSWYYNLRANPEVVLGGVPFRAEEVKDPAEQRRLWELADQLFPGFTMYRRSAGRADRAIPIVQLIPTAYSERSIRCSTGSPRR
jgi:deazaflavin-dependent oxidoreductase (nitroreductase family)